MPAAPPISSELEPRSYPRNVGWHSLPITTTWDGRAANVRAWVAFRLTDDLLEVAGGAVEEAPVSPLLPTAARTERLWEYSVVELFLVTAAGYLELELGPDGRYLAYSFGAPRERTASYEAHQAGAIPMLPGAGWASVAIFDRKSVFRMAGGPVQKLNAFAHLPGLTAAEPAAGRATLFAFHPLPGDRPDFHQPMRFPGWRGP